MCFIMRHHMHLHAFLIKIPMRIFKSPPQILVPHMKVGSTKALNRWDLNSQHATPTTTSLCKVPIKPLYLQFIALYSMALSKHVSRVIQCILYSWVSQVGLCLDNSWFNFLLLRPKIMILVFDKLTSRLEKMQNSYRLFRIICKACS